MAAFLKTCIIMTAICGLNDLLAQTPFEIKSRVVSAAEPNNGISNAEYQFSKKIQNLGKIAVQPLMDLLNHPKDEVRDLASFILRDIDGLNEDNLDGLKQSWKNGNQDVALAIANVGTPEAIRFLVQHLKHEMQYRNQLTFAFERLGKKGVPFLIEMLDEELNREASQNFLRILGDLEPGAVTPAITPLLKIAWDRKRHPESRVLAVKGIGECGKKAHEAVPTLKKLALREPALFEETVKMAILVMEAPESVNIYLQALKDEPSISPIDGIANLGRNGNSAGKSLMPYLDHSDWEVRLGTANAMGFIGYHQAIPKLISLLQNQDDWRLVYVSIKSLERLRAKPGLDELYTIASNHWYPQVRRAATMATASIHRPKTNKLKAPKDFDDFLEQFYEYDQIALSQLGKTPAFDKSNWVNSPETLSAIELKQLNYKVMSYYHKAMINPVPDAGIRFEEGFLVSSDRGEFGGELVHINTQGISKVIAPSNIQAMYRFGNQIVILAGIAHMSSNNGTIDRLIKNKKGDFIRVRWKTLPGSPNYSSKLKDGRLFISCNGGDLAIATDGKIEYMGP